MDALCAFAVWIDDVRLDSLRAGREAVITVTPGAHHVQLRWAPLWSSLGAKNSETLPFLVRPGQAVHFDCAYAWKAFRDTILLTRLDPTTPTIPDAGAVTARILAVTDTTRVEERLGEDERDIDNRAGRAPVTRGLKASREWTQTLTLGENHDQTLGGTAGAGVAWFSAKVSIEVELQRTLSVVIGSTHLFEEEISVTVPEHTAVRIVLAWKRIWQRGNAHVRLADGSRHIVPYQVAVSLTFDQKILDVTSHPQE